MQAINVCEEERAEIVLVIRQKCCSIGRRNLADVSVGEVVVLWRCKDTMKYVCRLRGMTYNISLKKQNPSFGIFDPVTTVKDGTKVKNGYPARPIEI